MSILKMRRPTVAVDENRVRLVATFHALLDRLDRGDLAGAASMQAELRRLGFNVTCRRLASNTGEVPRASR